MKIIRSTLAVLALATGATVLAGSDAWARDPDKETPVRFETVAGAVPTSPTSIAPSRGLDVAQAGASALGGAAIAGGVMWLHRRRPRLSI